MTMTDGCGANGNVTSAAFIAAVSEQTTLLAFSDPVCVCVWKAFGFESLHESMFHVLLLFYSCNLTGQDAQGLPPFSTRTDKYCHNRSTDPGSQIRSH